MFGIFNFNIYIFICIQVYAILKIKHFLNKGLQILLCRFWSLGKCRNVSCANLSFQKQLQN